VELASGIYVHWKRLKAGGKEAYEAAVVLGAPAVHCLLPSAQKAPETLDGAHRPGGLAGCPSTGKARTVDLLVPAEAEIVVEGWIETEYLEPEARSAIAWPRQPAGITPTWR